MVTDRPDINLMNALRTGDVVAFNTIYTEHSKSLYIYLLHKLKDPELCNDILQDIFVNLWEKKGQLNIDVSLKSYLFQAARFKIIDVYRLDVKYQKYLTEAAINNLPEKMREIFILSRYDHQSTRDIADKTKLSRQTVKNQLSKALRILRVNYISVDVITLFILSSLFAVVRF
jgi:DNA-directed RNA polymerase specialized sigma24 family protein